MGISYLSEQPFPPFQIDIYIPEWHLGIEIDGPYHSTYKDRKRDEIILERYRVPILRLDAVVGNTRKQRAEWLIRNFIEEHADTASDRKHAS